MERHRRHLEGEPGREEHEPEDDADRLMALQRLRDADERNGSGEAVDQRGAVEQHARRQSPEHEVLEPRFRGPGIVAMEGRDDV